MRRLRRICGASFVFVSAVALYTVSPGTPAGAAPNFRGIASADAVRMQVIVPNFPVTSSVVDTGLYSAEAVVTSNNQSQAFASTPYPGEGVVTLPGTLAGFGAAGIPEYPLFASSVHPDRPHSQVGDGPFKLVADSTETTSEASASSGAAGEQNIGSALTTASVKRAPDGSVLATSKANVDGFAANGVKIGTLASSATTKLLPDGKLERASSLDVAAVTVNDVAVKLTPAGVVAADQTVPLDTKAVDDALAQAHVTLSYIAPQETPNGIIGAGVRVAAAVEVPGSGVTNVIWTLGRSLAVIDSAALDDVLGDLPAGDVEPPPPPAETPPPDSTVSGVEAPAPPPAATVSFTDTGVASSFNTGPSISASVPALPVPTGVTDTPVEASREGDTGAEVAAPAPAAAAPTFTPTTPASLTGDDSSGFYLLLVAGAAGVVVLSQVLSLLGVKVR